MKSLKERLAEKAERQAREDAKLSGKVKSYRFALPHNGYPFMTKESDVAYVKERARLLVDKIRRNSAYQLYEGLKEAINAEEKRIAESRANRNSWWEPQHNIRNGISKYIVVVKNQDGTLKGEDGTIYVQQSPEPKPETTAPTTEQLAQRVRDLDNRTQSLQDEIPRSVEHAQRLLEDANTLEADLQEVLRQLEEEQNQPEELTPEVEDAIVQPSPPSNLPSITEIRLANNPSLPEGLTIPMDYVYSLVSRRATTYASDSDQNQVLIESNAETQV